MILEDYSGGAVLERLLRCERRIEGSLFRNLNELRRVNDQRRKADAEAASTLARWRDEDDQARKARAFAPWRPADGPSAADAAAGDQMCQTNPIGGGVSSWKTVGAGPHACPSGGRPRGAAPTETAAQPQSCETNPIGVGSGLVPGEESVCQTPTRAQEVGRGRPTYQETPGGVTTSAPADQLCETNPIGPEPDASQVLDGTRVMSDSGPEGLRKTNPIGSAPGGSGIPLVGPNHGRDAHATHGRDARATELTDPGVASAEPGGTDTPRGQSCETNPIPESLKFAVSSVKCTNEPNSGCRADQEIGVPGANGAKRSQFRGQADAVDRAPAAFWRPRP